MVACAESGDFRMSRPETDKGTFTVQATDVPMSYTRRKNRTTQNIQRKKARLTPIHEHEEIITSDEPENLVQCEETPSSINITVTSPNGECRDLSLAGTFERTDTPMLHRKSCDSKMFLDLDTFEEELENIPEQENKIQDPDVLSVLAKLPPRPKCKRKVLPPSITTVADNVKSKKKKLLKLRSKYENTLGGVNYSISKDLRNVMKKQSLQVLDEHRPKSAGHGIQVIRLSDLSSTNSSSVPDLPSILNKIAKSNEMRGLSRARLNKPYELEDTFNGRVIPKTSMYDDSGALSTPREDSDIKPGINNSASTLKFDNCLRGSDISSFYNMWDRDRHSRPFDRKDSEKFKINVHRDCLCSIRNCAKKCFNQRNNVLPPISPSRDI